MKRNLYHSGRWTLGKSIAAAAPLFLLYLYGAGACGVDSDTPQQSTVSTTVATGSSSSTGSGSGGNGGAGGSAPQVFCDPDGRCAGNEHCACYDCWAETKCNGAANCIADGICGAKEGCFCADCKAEPECANYCIGCQQYTAYFSSVGALCTEGAPSSADYWHSLRTCACDTACANECDKSLCAGLSGSSACNQCLETNCISELTTCRQDIRPAVRCNPVTGAPCNLPGGERCDRLYVRDVHVGFACYLQKANAGLGEACDYSFGSDTHCNTTSTCVNAGAPATTGVCARYCCGDEDCGAGGNCVVGPFEAVTPGVGVCVNSPMASADAPSAGACVTLTPVP